MTAAVGYPTLRLIRQQIGAWTLADLQPGQWQTVACPPSPAELQRLMQPKTRRR